MVDRWDANERKYATGLLLLALSSIVFAVVIILWIVAVVVDSGTLGGVGGILIIPTIVLFIVGAVLRWVD